MSTMMWGNGRGIRTYRRGWAELSSDGDPMSVDQSSKLKDDNSCQNMIETFKSISSPAIKSISTP